jgi:hypothetical protein
LLRSREVLVVVGHECATGRWHTDKGQEASKMSVSIELKTPGLEEVLVGVYFAFSEPPHDCATNGNPVVGMLSLPQCLHP